MQFIRTKLSLKVYQSYVYHSAFYSSNPVTYSWGWHRKKHYSTLTTTHIQTERKLDLAPPSPAQPSPTQSNKRPSNSTKCYCPGCVSVFKIVSCVNLNSLAEGDSSTQSQFPPWSVSGRSQSPALSQARGSSSLRTRSAAQCPRSRTPWVGPDPMACPRIRFPSLRA